MKSLTASFITEFLKLKRSKIVWITFFLFAFIPTMMGLLMWVAQHPEVASKLGLVGTKASFFEENNWAGFFILINQIIATIGLIGFGFVAAWVFGREYLEKTIIDILVLPVSRQTIVSAKFLIVFFWCLILTIILFASSLIMGKLIAVPGWTEILFIQFMKEFFTIAFLTMLLCTPVGFVASYGRGIVAPIGCVILLLIISQFVSLAGLGPYFPWAIPGIMTVTEPSKGFELVNASYVIVVLTALAGYFGTTTWWKRADQH